MMSASLSWLRRANLPWNFLIIGTMTTVLVSSRSGWQHDGQWATSWAVGSTIVIGPLLAGITAFSVQRGLTPTMRHITASAVRGTRGVMILTLGLWTAACTAWVIVVAYAVLRAAATTNLFYVSWWDVSHGLIVLVTAAFVGAAVGVLVPGLVAGPVAAIGTYLLPLILMPLGISGILAAGGATIATPQYEANPPVFIAMMIGNLALVPLCCSVVAAKLTPIGGSASALRLIFSAVLVTVSLNVLAQMSPQLGFLRPVAGDELCVGDETIVCGPAHLEATLPSASSDLSRARAELAKRGLEVSSRYIYAPASSTDVGTGGWFVSANVGNDASLARWDLSVSLATPTVCDEYFAERPPEELLDGRGRLAAWIMESLSDVENEPAGEDVQATIEALGSCNPGALPEWALE